MSGFHEVRFPDAIARGATGGPGYATTIITTSAGFERRNVNWEQARGRWDVGSGIKRRTDFEELIAFFRARQGRAYGFRFKDWTDFGTPAQVPLGVGDGTARTFQLVKRYTSGGAEVVRTITKPVAGTVRVFIGGVLRQTGVSVSTSTGLVTFSSAPAAGAVVAAECEFDVPVRFDTDQMALSLEHYEHGTWGQIPIVEIKL
ncbi:DUF2460 domain-containing protein [Paracoccus sp. Z118]|uniref:DUF2460 domain-containing protein n=1 Tax=Paracoccus sp. Z118 TaxID=2851017 RepID=UPI001C2C8FAA|nr:DUF2460 domain-containing protein [Paracoccus sp. Z118]MBV0891522.1 DUF2460 domain-containing protein [Paracoccus sp. Z118]